MKILAFDTTATIESVAILIDNEVVLVKELQQRSSAAEILTSNISEIMVQQKLQFSDLDAIAVTRLNQKIATFAAPLFLRYWR